MNCSAIRRTGHEGGFTLVELAVAMPIMLIVMGGLVLMLTTITHWSSQTQEETILQTEARSAMNRLEAEIRGAFIGDGTAEITNATATSITFTTPDESATSIGNIPVANTEAAFHLLTVSYRLTGGMLQRQFKTSTNTYPAAPPWTWSGSMSPWATVVGQSNSITNTNVFTYYNVAGAQASPPTPLTFPVANPTGIRAVGVNLTLSTGGSQPEKFTVTDIVTLRETDN